MRSDMPELPLLLPIQKALLIDLVEAAERMPSTQRAHFIAYRRQGDDTETTALAHPGLESGHKSIFFGDLRTLAHNGLLLLDRQAEKSYEITLLPEAYLQYGAIKQPTSPEVRTAVREVVAGTLARARRALRVFERTAAAYGSVSLPPHVAIELEDKRVEVAELEQRLKDLVEHESHNEQD
jgi:hypothetical protein